MKHWFFLFMYVFILILSSVAFFFDAMFVAQTISCIMNTGDFHAGLINAGICLAITSLAAILTIVNTYFQKQLENRTKLDIQQNILKSALEIQMKSYDEMGSGLIVTRLTADIDNLSVRFTEFANKVVNILRKLAYVVYIFFLNVWLGLFLVGTIVLTSIVYSVRVYYLKKYKPGVLSAAEKVNSKIIEVIRGVKDIKTLNCSENILEIMKKDQLTYNKKDNFEWYLGSSLYQISNIARYVCNFFFIFLCIFLMREYSLTPLIFYTCFIYKDNVLDFATIFGDLRITLGNAEVCASRIFSIANPTYYEVDQYGNETIEDFSGDIIFKNVKFSYDNKKDVLKNASFEILPRQTVAFVGESGCGKSTIINLIAHLYTKKSGKILFDNVPIENLSKDFIKNNIAVVNQFPYIFNITIRDNFKIIKPDITDEEIFALCKETRILSHIKKLPNGLDSIIGEGGCQFSGGQRQKICIARALARNVKILIFDEATSALDNSSQKEIMKVIENLKNRMTIILIAHRLSTITYADCIYLMNGGHIIAQGTHEELMQKSEYYQRLYNTDKTQSE
ncbi:MAG: ABC transporter ATP-binding protein/permease, partial [Clostridia bacterium]|nr:ABC transporter ATP-binding protein/permease [Clostridia bacterium]